MAIQLTKPGDTITVKDADLVAGGDPETSYTLQLLTRKVYRDITKRHTKSVSNRRSHQMEDRTDWVAVSDDLLDYVLQGWNGILYDGQPAECTRDNKSLVDGPRTSAMLELAGLSQVQNIADAKADSFRST